MLRKFYYKNVVLGIGGPYFNEFRGFSLQDALFIKRKGRRFLSDYRNFPICRKIIRQYSYYICASGKPLPAHIEAIVMEENLQFIVDGSIAVDADIMRPVVHVDAVHPPASRIGTAAVGRAHAVHHDIFPDDGPRCAGICKSIVPCVNAAPIVGGDADMIDQVFLDEIVRAAEADTDIPDGVKDAPGNGISPAAGIIRSRRPQARWF